MRAATWIVGLMTCLAPGASRGETPAGPVPEMDASEMAEKAARRWFGSRFVPLPSAPPRAADNFVPEWFGQCDGDEFELRECRDRVAAIRSNNTGAESVEYRVWTKQKHDYLDGRLDDGPTFAESEFKYDFARSAFVVTFTDRFVKEWIGACDGILVSVAKPLIPARNAVFCKEFLLTRRCERGLPATFRSLEFLIPMAPTEAREFKKSLCKDGTDCPNVTLTVVASLRRGEDWRRSFQGHDDDGKPARCTYRGALATVHGVRISIVGDYTQGPGGGTRDPVRREWAFPAWMASESPSSNDLEQDAVLDEPDTETSE